LPGRVEDGDGDDDDDDFIRSIHILLTYVYGFWLDLAGLDLAGFRYVMLHT
jgi:hypothetical protein